MCMNAINFLYNSGHVILWCLEVVPVVYTRVVNERTKSFFKKNMEDDVKNKSKAK